MPVLIANNKNLTIFIAIIAFSALLIGGVFIYYYHEISDKKQAVASYEECVALGNKIQESYPPKCVTKDGQEFSQEIGNVLELTNEIVIAYPTPNQVIEEVVEIKGTAVGSWLFEGQTGMKLYNKDNQVVAEGPIKADGDWMTDKMVPFSGRLEFDQPDPQKGKLVIEKSNPSGDPKNAKELIIPIYFK